MNQSIVYTLTIIWLFASCFIHAAQVSGSLKTYILKRHNDARDAVKNGQARGRSGTLPCAKSMNHLRWSSNLANTASQYAKTCPNNGQCVHSKPQGFTPSGGWSRYGVSSVGENIGCPGWKGKSSLTQQQVTSYFNQMIDDELKKYTYQNKFMYAAGHYTQIIWAKTTQVGCGYHKCSTGWWLVCHYSPPGNYPTYPYEKGTCGSSGGGYTGGSSTGGYTGGSSSSSSGSSICVSNINGRLNGKWYKKGSKNGAPYYKKGSYYLFKSSGGYYTTNTRLSDPSSWDSAGYCPKNKAITSCSNQWVQYSQRDSNSRFSSCGSLEDPTCFDNYEQRVHFHADSSGELTHIFDRDDEEGCLYDQPVFKYDDVDNEMQYSLYFDSNQWVIEGNQNVSNYRIKREQFVCEEEDLYECTAGRWFEEIDVQDVQDVQDVSGDVNGSASNTSLAVPLTNLVMLLAMEDAEIKAFSAKDGGDSGGGAIVIVCIVGILVVLIASGYLIYRCRNKQKMKTNAKQMEIPDDEEDEDEVEDGEEMEVTVPIHTDT
eukprot:492356_1